MINLNTLEKCLKKVDKPARYIGGEVNQVVKDFENIEVRFAFCFPDVYEVGMSHLGLHILYYLTNAEEDFLCERAFAPWPDMEDQMRASKVKLYSLESKMPLDAFDIIGFTLQYEMSYTNVLNMLDLAGIPVLASERGDGDPLIIAGGPCATTPEPMADFIDLFIFGEGEEVNLELFRLYQDSKKKGETKEEFLIRACAIEGIYVPRFYQVDYKEDGTIKSRKSLIPEAREVIKRVRVSNVDDMYVNDQQIVPFIQTVHDRVVMELFRGCTQGCRFCQAGMLYRPIREKSRGHLNEIAENLLSSTGYDEISLSSLSSCDYSNLMPLIHDLVERYEKDYISIGLPSLRLDSFIVDTLKEIEKVRKSGLTFAPEAGSQRLRDVINKGVTEEDLMNVARDVFSEGWSRMKLYFMIGLPTETMEDVLAISDLGYKVKDIFFNRPPEEIKGNFTVTLSTSCFVPKAYTPFQWYPQNRTEEFLEKISGLRDSVRDPKIKFQYHQPLVSQLEAILARGDRRVGKLIYSVWKRGQKFDGWTEHFDYENWVQAMEETGIDPEFFIYRTREFDEILPWDFIDIGVSKDYLWKEYQRALKGDRTKDCRQGCNGCGIQECEMWEVFHESKNTI